MQIDRLDAKAVRSLVELLPGNNALHRTVLEKCGIRIPAVNRRTTAEAICGWTSENEPRRLQVLGILMRESMTAAVRKRLDNALQQNYWYVRDSDIGIVKFILKRLSAPLRDSLIHALTFSASPALLRAETAATEVLPTGVCDDPTAKESPPTQQVESMASSSESGSVSGELTNGSGLAVSPATQADGKRFGQVQEAREWGDVVDKDAVLEWFRGMTREELTDLAGALRMPRKVAESEKSLLKAVYDKIPVEAFTTEMVHLHRKRNWRNKEKVLESLEMIFCLTHSMLSEDALGMLPPPEFRQGISALCQEMRPRLNRNNPCWRETLEKEVESCFVGPLLGVLGWSWRDYKRERPIEGQRGRSYRADYLVSLFQRPAFFVEVKKPAVGLRKEAFEQARQYALWHRGTRWFVLTDGTVLTLCHTQLECPVCLVPFLSRDWRLNELDIRRLYLLSRDSFAANRLDEAFCKSLGDWTQLLSMEP